MAYPIPTGILPYPRWNQFTPTLPALYWDVDSHEERIKRICLELHKLVEYANYLGRNINLDHETIEKLEVDFDKFMESGFDDYYKEQLVKYIEEHFGEIVYKMLNTGVYFGLTQDGYFCANVAYQLAFVLDTIAEYSNDDYGRLTITY